MTVYIAEEFTAEEADVLRRYFTNLDQPVFALVNPVSYTHLTLPTICSV